MAKLKANDLALWWDDSLLAVNKPAGLTVLQDGFDPQAPHLRSVLEPEFGPLWIVHRIDRDTSGLVILARTEAAHRALNRQFAERQIGKLYHALVPGVPSWESKTVRLPLRPDGDRRHRTVIDQHGGKPAVTRLRLIESFSIPAHPRRPYPPAYSLIEARPQTGRTHQIRAHLGAVGFPLVADALYGSDAGVLLSQVKPNYHGDLAEERPLISRPGLHAYTLHMEHPESGESIKLEAPYPKDLTATLRQLRKYCLS